MFNLTWCLNKCLSGSFFIVRQCRSFTSADEDRVALYYYIIYSTTASTTVLVEAVLYPVEAYAYSMQDIRELIDRDRL